MVPFIIPFHHNSPFKVTTMRYAEAFVAIASFQFETMVAFYEALLKQAPCPFVPDRYAQWSLRGGLKLGIFSPQQSHRHEFQSSQPGPVSLCFEVQDLESTITYLTELGYPPQSSIQTASHGREIYAYDPEGNRLILHQGWGEESDA
jgi:predicted enzyme related to lactoylglutathione lyase